MQPRTKIFGIGFQKTGTTTLNHALKMLGYRFVPGKIRGKMRRDLIAGGTLEAWTGILAEWDAFADHPFFWPRIAPGSLPFYTWAVERYPDARFILTRRASAEAWRKSMVNHMKRGGHYPNSPEHGTDVYAKREVVFGAEAVDAMDLDRFTRVYEDYNREAVDFFRTNAPDRFIELCWEEGHAWPELCGFLGVRRPWFRRFPHSNQAQKKKNKTPPAGTPTP